MREPRGQAPDYRRRRLAAIAVLLTAVACGIVIAGALLGGSGRELDEPAAGVAEEDRNDAVQETAAEPSAAAPQEAAAGGAVDVSEWSPSRDPVPMLMYHDVEAPPADAPFPELHVPEDVFAEQLDWLEDHGYTAVTMEQVENAWNDGAQLPRKPVVISFDDGFDSHHRVALPELSRRGWPGVINLQTLAPRELPEDAPLDPDEVEDLLAAGWELASHTISHADLTTVDAVQLESELERSKKALERQFGVEVNHLCYPAGKYDETVIEAVRAAGYTSASTVEPGLASREEPYALRRIRINASDGVDGMVQQLEAAGA